MAQKAKKSDGTVQLSTSLPAELVERFRAQCDRRGFKQVVLIERLIEYWLSLPDTAQVDIYVEAEKSEALFRQKVLAILAAAQELPAEKLRGRKANKPKAG